MKIRRLIAASRFFIIIPVIGSFVISLTLLIYGGYKTINLPYKAWATFSSDYSLKTLSLTAIEIIDLFLLGTIFYIIALGLYELFIDDQITLPDWLNIHDFDQLKAKLIGVVVVIMGVIFLSQLVGWDGERNLLEFGAGIALVIASLTWYLKRVH